MAIGEVYDFEFCSHHHNFNINSAWLLYRIFRGDIVGRSWYNITRVKRWICEIYMLQKNTHLVRNLNTRIKYQEILFRVASVDHNWFIYITSEQIKCIKIITNYLNFDQKWMVNNKRLLKYSLENIRDIYPMRDIDVCWNTLAFCIDSPSATMCTLRILEDFGYMDYPKFLWDNCLYQHGKLLDLGVHYRVSFLIKRCLNKRILHKLFAYNLPTDRHFYKDLCIILNESFGTKPLWYTKLLYRYISSRTTITDLDDALISACKNGRLGHVRFWFRINESFSQMCIQNAILEATSNGHQDIVEYIKNKCNLDLKTRCICWSFGKMHDVFVMIGLK